MAIDKPIVPKDATAAKSLAHVLDQSERIKDVVEECAEDLAAVNSTLKNELENRPPLPGVESALQKSESVESKVQDAADDLTNVNRALEAEVKERHLLEHELIAVKKQEEAARHAALHDPLTSLPNRVLFNDRLEHGLAQARRHDWTLAVMFIDLDNFKNINDTHGHVVGDAVLQAIALRLKNMTRDDDTVCRHGGDEFLYLLLELKQASDAAMVAEKIILAVGEPCEVNAHDGPLQLSVKPSIGIAIFPTAGDTVDTLIESADRAMYQAKRDKTGYAFAE